MAKFDVYVGQDDDYWLDCQADILSDLNSRLVVPLRAVGEPSYTNRRLNPRFVLDDHEYVMLTHLAAAVSTRFLRQQVASLADQEHAIGAAIDMLISGY
jgi:toxin CcdB